jgi:hypothetical protein
MKILEDSAGNIIQTTNNRYYYAEVELSNDEIMEVDLTLERPILMDDIPSDEAAKFILEKARFIRYGHGRGVDESD